MLLLPQKKTEQTECAAHKQTVSEVNCEMARPLDDEDFQSVAPTLWDRFPTRGDLLRSAEALSPALGALTAVTQVAKQAVRLWELAGCDPVPYVDVARHMEAVRVKVQAGMIQEVGLQSVPDFAVPLHRRNEARFQVRNCWI